MTTSAFHLRAGGPLSRILAQRAARYNLAWEATRSTSTAKNNTGCSSEPANPRLTLMAPGELDARLRSDDPPLVLEACYSLRGSPVPDRCVPGALLVDLADLERSEEDAQGRPLPVSGNYSLVPPTELRAVLEAAGVTRGRPVVVYTQNLRADGDTQHQDLAPATRLAWTLSVAGCEHVSLLAGGLRAWVESGLTPATAHAAAASGRVDFFGNDYGGGGGSSSSSSSSSGGGSGGSGSGTSGLPFPLRPYLTATTEDVEAIVRGESKSGDMLADVRTWREFTGASTDYPFPVPLGRIPGAKWVHWGPKVRERREGIGEGGSRKGRDWAGR